MSNAFLPDENNQPIHLKWRNEVVLNYDKLREESNHIEAYKARHRYTNYDQLVDEIKSQREASAATSSFYRTEDGIECSVRKKMEL